MNISLLLTFDDAIHKQHHIVGTLTDAPVNDIKTSDEFGNDLYIYGCQFSYDKDADDNITVTKFMVIYPYTPEAEYHFVTNTKIEKLYAFDLDGDCAEAAEVRHVDPNNKNYELRGFEVHFCDNGQYNVINKHLMTMNHYQFDRSKLSKMFSEIITSNDTLLEKIEDARYNGVIGDFKLWTEDEEFYMLHVPSGTIVGWYKFYHYGRDNFCNKDMNENDLRDFFWLLRHQMLGEPDVPELPEPTTTPAVTVKEVDQSPTPTKIMSEIKLPQLFNYSDNKVDEHFSHELVKKLNMEHDAAKIQRNSIYGVVGFIDQSSDEKVDKIDDNDDDTETQRNINNDPETKELDRIFERMHDWAIEHATDDDNPFFVEEIQQSCWHDFEKFFYIRLSDNYSDTDKYYNKTATVYRVTNNENNFVAIEVVNSGGAEAIFMESGEYQYAKGKAIPRKTWSKHSSDNEAHFYSEYHDEAWKQCVSDPNHKIKFKSTIIDKFYREWFGTQTEWSPMKSNEEGSNENNTD